MLSVHFLKSNTVSGWLIRLFTFSQWNHVSIEIDGQVYEARGRKGVTQTRAKGYLNHWARTSTVQLNAPSPVSAAAFLDAQIGKRYDFGGIIALPFRKSWHGRSKWFSLSLSLQP